MSFPVDAKLSNLLEDAVAGQVAPTAAAAVWFRGEWFHVSAAGEAPPEPATLWFDLASLTKPLATGLCAMRLAELGELALDAPVARYLPGFAKGGKAEIEVQDLLDHTSGLPAWRPYFRAVVEDPIGGPAFRGYADERAFARGRELVAAAVDGETPDGPRREATVYSDVGFLALGRVLEKVAGEPLDLLVRREVFDRLAVADVAFFDIAKDPVPVGMSIAATGSTRPRAPAAGQERALAGLPLEPVGTCPGEVDDDNAFACGGVAGHAGLFGTVVAAARLAQAFLEETEGAGRLAGPELVKRFAAPRKGSIRPLGWDRPSPGSSSAGRRIGRGPRGAVGHLGFTGCSVWIDLDARLVVALCTNRSLTGRTNQKIRTFRPQFHNAVGALLGL